MGMMAIWWLLGLVVLVWSSGLSFALLDRPETGAVKSHPKRS